MLLSYADTSRVIEPVLRPRVMSVNGLVSGTFLLDGFVNGVEAYQDQNLGAT